MASSRKAWQAPDVALIAANDSDETERLRQYLQRFGHISEDAASHTPNLSEALKELQEHAGLPENGQYDEATASFVQKPRCLMTARDISDSQQDVWSKFNLSWEIRDYPSTLGSDSVKTAITNAFNEWQNHSFFTFENQYINNTVDNNLTWSQAPPGQLVFTDGEGHVLAQANYPRGQPWIQFDDAEVWDQDKLQGVSLHEIGHRLGLTHSLITTSVMFDTYHDQLWLQSDDINRLRALYQPQFGTVLKSSTGLGGYDLRDTRDRGFSFAYNRPGIKDHVFFYRLETGVCWIVGPGGNGWAPRFESSTGLGGFGLKRPEDLAFPITVTSGSGTDAICLYRPGSRACFVVSVEDGQPTTLYQSDPSGQGGIGGFDLANTADRGFALDYNSSGQLDHICFYRPGTGVVWIVGPGANSTWNTVFQSSSGIGGFDMKRPEDQAFAFDYNKTGLLDHICLYRPGSGVFCVATHQNGQWIQSFWSGIGIGGREGFDLRDQTDRVIALNKRHLFGYRPGTGACFILRQDDTTKMFLPIYAQGVPDAQGIGGYDLKSASDTAFTLDWIGFGNQMSNNLVLMRPGSGTLFVMDKYD